MKNIFDDLKKLESYLSKKDLCLFLDYDGTLAPIADKPKNAVLDPAVQLLLKKLAKFRTCHMYVVSGRALMDVRDMVGLDNIGYVGNHGMEMEVPRVVFGNFDFARSKEVMSFLKEEIEKAISFFKGSFVEHKGVTLSVHYRLVRPELEESIKRLLVEIVKPFVVKGEVYTDFGKKVFEIRPPIDWDKGQAVLWLLDEHFRASGKMPAAIYIGDDRTDEDAFRALKGKGMVIKVGGGQTIAEYYMREQKEIVTLLKIILRIKQRGWIWDRFRI